MTKQRIRVRLDPHATLAEIVESAAERACNRHDKYADQPLSEASRSLLVNEFEASFWLAVDDANISFTR